MTVYIASVDIRDGHHGYSETYYISAKDIETATAWVEKEMKVFWGDETKNVEDGWYEDRFGTVAARLDYVCVADGIPVWEAATGRLLTGEVRLRKEQYE